MPALDDITTEVAQSVPIHLHDSKASPFPKLKRISLLRETARAAKERKTISLQVIDEPGPEDPTTPVTVGPNGSGYKGTGKSHSEYARDANIYGYQGSYSRQNQNQRQRQPPEPPKDLGPSNGGPGGAGEPGGGAGSEDRRGHEKLFTDEQLVNLRHQIYAFKCLSKNIGVPTATQELIFARQQTDSPLTADQPLGAVTTNAGNATLNKNGVHATSGRERGGGGRDDVGIVGHAPAQRDEGEF